MIIALVDNGSLEPAAHCHLRAVASDLTARTEVSIHPVSWKHSDRLAAARLGGTPAWTLGPFVRTLFALGQRRFCFVPFFITAQGAVGTALQADLATLRRELAGFDFVVLEGLAESAAIPLIAAARIRETMAELQLEAPHVIVVDHGGPSSVSAQIREETAIQIRALLTTEIGSLSAASMEGTHPPFLADQLRDPSLAGRDVVVAPLFLSPGRHAGPAGDLAKICHESPVRYHLTGLIGTHPLAVGALATCLNRQLPTLQVSSVT